MSNQTIKKVLPVLFGFFIMGMVDLVGISTNYVKQDYNLSDTMANLLPMMVFLWFAILAVPTGMIMNTLGRKTTVVISMAISLAAMILPLVAYNFTCMLIAFGLLGIGNTIIQVSLNPLITNVINEDKLTSALTFGQFIKAIASFLGPVIAGWAAIRFGDWKYVFLIFGIVTIISCLWLTFTPIQEEKLNQKTTSFGKVFGLLKNNVILKLFIGILFIVGIDVGLNTTIPKFLMDSTNIALEKAGLGISLYFVARTVGSFVGAIILVRFSGRKYFIWSMLVGIPAFIVMLLIPNLWSILVMIFIVGLAVANVFSIIFSAALREKPDYANEISGLLIMGVAGGAVIPMFMGMTSDAFGQAAGMAILLVLMAYLLYCALKIKS